MLSKLVEHTFIYIEVIGHEAHYHHLLFPEAWMSLKDPECWE